MAAALDAQWGVAIASAAASTVIAAAALVAIATPAFAEGTGSHVRVALSGVVPALAILAVASAAQASSRVPKTPWGAAILGVLGSGAASVAFETWYAGVDAAAPQSDAPLLVAACASVALNGAALAVLVHPALRTLPTGAAIALLTLVAVCGGTATLLLLFPMVSALAIAAGAVIAVLLMRRAETRAALDSSVVHP